MPGPRMGKPWRSPPSTSCSGKISQPTGRISAGSAVSRAPLWAAVPVPGSFQPITKASRDSGALDTPVENTARIQNHCQEPYYQAVPPAQGSHCDLVKDQPSIRFVPQL
uniref:Complement C1r n=1 Tax=Oryctolagus cuniculus TaxID=9986 RepID=A0A5F9CJ74_RABIT